MPRKALPDNPLAALKTKPKRKAKTAGPPKAAKTKQAPDGTPKRNRTIYLPPELDRRLRLHAAEHDKTASDVVAEALEAHLKGKR